MLLVENPYVLRTTDYSLNHTHTFARYKDIFL
jgi:hypothetical protein